MSRLARLLKAWLVIDALFVLGLAAGGGDPLANAHPFIRRGAGCPLPPDFVPDPDRGGHHG